MKNKHIFLIIIVSILFICGSCKEVHYPGIPINLTVEKQSGGCLLKWEPAKEDVSANEDPNLFYYIYKSINIHGKPRIIEKTAKGKTYFLDRSVKKGEVYSYYLIASWKGYISEPSLPITVDYTN